MAISIRLLPLVFLSGALAAHVRQRALDATPPSVYRNQPPAGSATVPQSVGDGGRWNYTGCYTDSVLNRVLPEKAGVNGGMTAEKCTSACQAKGFPFAGTEYAKGTPSLSFLSYDLWCGNILNSKSTTTCDMRCTGDASQICGGGNCITVFHDTPPTNVPQSVGDGGGWKYTGCYTDSVSNRTFPTSANVEGGMTAEKCTNACQAKGFPFAGCGDLLNSAPASGCDMACTGDGSQNCGGGNRLSVFHDSSESTMPVATTLTCVDRTTEDDFTLQAVFRDGSPPVNLLVTHSTSSTAVITSCTNCSTPYISYSLYEGAFYAEADTNPAIAVSPPLAAGEIVTLSTVEHKMFTGYCTVTSGDAMLLAGNDRSDRWALCPNAAANGRMEVVWDPKPGHSQYILEECQKVDLQVIYCEPEESDQPEASD
ncbi:hypothetical protein B0H11DRAFT_2331160 [Mycena galericulata]|nr:hypothetical protein B0H11DRAFT_2331160 [Mycena galericulata]